MKAHGLSRQVIAALTPVEEGSDLAVRVQLLGGFAVTQAGAAVALPLATQRLVAFLALAGRPLGRAVVAGRLWFDSSESRAHACLRSALWRLRLSAAAVIVSSRGQLRLSPHVMVDVDEQIALGRRIREPAAVVTDTGAAIALLEAELLPGWYDEWLLVERERLRQLTLHALDGLCASLVEQTRFSEAIEVGVAAVRAEPLRESAHRVLIDAHLAEGNRTEALRHYRMYCAMLQRRLRIEPSAELRALVAFAEPARHAREPVV